MDFLKSTKGGPFGSAGGRIPEWRSCPPPPPKSAPEHNQLQHRHLYQKTTEFLLATLTFCNVSLHLDWQKNNRLRNFVCFKTVLMILRTTFTCLQPGADSGGGGGGAGGLLGVRPSSLRDSIPCRPKGSTF